MSLLVRTNGLLQCVVLELLKVLVGLNLVDARTVAALALA